jgi:carboxypeptidase C (cathepsin A)
MYEHYRTFLEVRMPRPYEALADDAHAQWRWLTGGSTPSGGRFVNVVPYLEEALRRNADFRILVAGGCFDLATPLFGAENAMAELRLGTDRVTFAGYRSGHMLYLQGDVRREFLEDVRRFVAAEPRPNP